MKANEIYKKAQERGLTLECTCSEVTEKIHEKLFDGATVANKRIVNKLVAPFFEKDFTKLWNPYQSYKTKTHIIFVHSAIDHFFKIN